MAKPNEVPTYLAELERALVNREATTGFDLLRRCEPEINQTSISDQHAPMLLLCIAQWVDIGYTPVKLFDDFYARMACLEVRQLSVIDFLRLELAAAFKESYYGNEEVALGHLHLVRLAGERVLPDNLRFLTAYWLGRLLRRRGEYKDALGFICSAQQIATLMGASRLVAVTKIHESWLVFQNGQRAAAFDLLDEAEKELLPTGHFLSLGNIESARGRFVRRAGEYTRALQHFENAITLFAGMAPAHANLARALVNAAYVKRLIALDLRTRQKAGPAKGRQHERHQKIVGEALKLLEGAREIYALHHHQGGTGSVLVNTGHLHLDIGDIERAGHEASNAFLLGQRRHDTILMSRARTLQSAVELERADEELGDEQDAALHAQLAVTRASEAVELAEATQNRRLLAEAYLARGNAAAQVLLQDWDTARHFLTKASELLTADDRDHLLQDLGQLRVRILAATTIDERLRRWSGGEVDGMTFQQVEEAFAQVVIPKVWIRCGRNVARVAEALSISPKKVRRILKSTGN